MAVKKTNNTAVLLVHGILGRPEQFKDLLPLIPKKWYIRNLTLKGHGSTPEELGKYPVSEWKAEVHREAAELCDNYEHVYIVGHSLGTIFAIQESLVLPVEKLFLINVPLRVGLPADCLNWDFRCFLTALMKMINLWWQPKKHTAFVLIGIFFITGNGFLDIWNCFHKSVRHGKS